MLAAYLDLATLVPMCLVSMWAVAMHWLELFPSHLVNKYMTLLLATAEPAGPAAARCEPAAGVLLGPRPGRETGAARVLFPTARESSTGSDAQRCLKGKSCFFVRQRHGSRCERQPASTKPLSVATTTSERGFHAVSEERRQICFGVVIYLQVHVPLVVRPYRYGDRYL